MSDQKTLEYYFDFSSPYGYLGTLFVEQLAQDIGRELVWKPYLMGAAMKITGLPTLNKIPLKSDYMWVDLKRYSDQFNVTMRTPNGFLSCLSRLAVRTMPCWRKIPRLLGVGASLLPRLLGKGGRICRT